MSLFTGRSTIFTRQAAGNGFIIPITGSATPTVTAAAAASGFFTCSIGYNGLGLAFPGTLVGFQIPAFNNSMRAVMAQSSVTTSSKTLFLARIYRFGTVTLGATGDNFTHDAGTFPVLRTQFGKTNDPVTLIPIIQITVAPTVTAPAFILDTVAVGSGYVNQDGNSVVGTKTFTFPSATTVLQSTFIMRLEEGDSGVRDITHINCTVAGTSSPTAAVYGMELLAPVSNFNVQTSATVDLLFGGLSLADLNPANSTSGSITSYLVLFQSGGTGGAQPCIYLIGATDV